MAGVAVVFVAATNPLVGGVPSWWRRAHRADAKLSSPMISLESWWWPKRPARVPRAWTAGLLAALGAALFGVAALLLKAGAVKWDVSLFRILNEVPPAASAVLTPLPHLFLPAGIIAVVVLTVVYVVARNRSALPVAAGAVAAGPHGRWRT